MVTSASVLLLQFGVALIAPKVFDSRHTGSGNVRAGRQVSKYEDSRSRRCQGREEQARLLQPEYDGSDNIGNGGSA